MEKINSYKLAEILGCPAVNLSNINIDNVSTDSRNVSLTTLFIALKGERFDAHDFVADVIAKGLSVCIGSGGAPGRRGSGRKAIGCR